MTQKHVIILGLSVGGVSAALILADAGYVVEFYEIENDLALRERFQVVDRSWGVTRSGMEYEDAARESLLGHGVIIHDGQPFASLSESSDIGLNLRSGLSQRVFIHAWQRYFLPSRRRGNRRWYQSVSAGARRKRLRPIDRPRFLSLSDSKTAPTGARALSVASVWAKTCGMPYSMPACRR